MSASTYPSPTPALWRPEYERLAVHCSSCRICTAVDEKGVNLKLPCAEGRQFSEEYRRACRSA